jgi:ribosomal protein S6
MPLYEFFLILDASKREKFETLKKLLLKLYDNNSVLVGLNFHGQTNLPYRIKKLGEFKFEGRYVYILILVSGLFPF